MFTVKHHHTYGGHHVYACDNYIIVPPGTESPVGKPNDNPEVILFDKPVPQPVGVTDPVGQGSMMKIEAHKGSVIYIENAEGHTVDILRPPVVVNVTKEDREEYRKRMEEKI